MVAPDFFVAGFYFSEMVRVNVTGCAAGEMVTPSDALTD